MSASPIRLEWDVDGLHVVIDLAAMEDVNTLATRFVPDGEGSITARLDGDQALALYDEVDANLREWVAEGRAAQRAVAAGVPLAAFTGDPSEPGAPGNDDDRHALDPSDPKHPDYADRLAAGGDASRKEAREDGR